MKKSISFFIFSFLFFASVFQSAAQPVLKYTVSVPDPGNQLFHNQLQVANADADTLLLKMPAWMPGYYQLMNYADKVENMTADEGVVVEKINRNTWQIIGCRNKKFSLNYDVKADRRFVANSFLDASHGYLVPTANFLYIDGKKDLPVTVSIDLPSDAGWNNIATGLQKSITNKNEFTASNFDILFDCPILMGDLEELPSFRVAGINHRFIAYQPGEFDREKLMSQIKKVVEAAVEIFGEIPYKEYTFIGIGPGRGGIEHLNNTTISFDGNSLKTDADYQRVLNFIGHEYFHHYNVKRIRPFELGPFDYDRENRTSQLWISEGLTVYYEYLIVKRAGLSSEKDFLTNFEGNINAVENNPGRKVQSLTQASYSTWSDGPFGNSGAGKNQTISVYDKGPVVGLFLDFAIRNATQNQKSLDDVMRQLYFYYYRELERGFTDAEFQATCETIAGTPLSELFEYVSTTKELDYNKYLGFAGLQLSGASDSNSGEKVIFKIKRTENPGLLQTTILKSWLGEEM